MKNIIYVEHKHFVTVKNYSLKFVDVISKEQIFVPLEDVQALIFEHQASYFTNRLFVTCLKHNILIIICDETHTPLTMVTNDYGHSLKYKRIRKQITFSLKNKNRVWKKIVSQKIINQAECVKYSVGNNEVVNKLIGLAKDINEGDPANYEALAARLYFTALFGKNFRRGRYSDVINASLNYGYAVIRSFIRQQIVIHGLEPSIGIHHQSTENPYNFSDDIIEVFRPFVDAYVFDNIVSNNCQNFDVTAKKLMIQVMFEKCVIDDKVYYLSDAIEIALDSITACIEENRSSQVKLPRMIEGGR